MLNSDHCPLFVPGLSAWKKVLFCSGVWAYIVGAITTPFFIVVPLVTIWGGIFPIIVSKWAACAHLWPACQCGYSPPFPQVLSGLPVMKEGVFCVLAVLCDNTAITITC